MPDSEIAQNINIFATGAVAAAERRDPPYVSLVEHAVSGDADAFGEIYRAFKPLVHGIVLAYVPYDDAGDVVQEVFLAAYKSLHTLREKAAVGAWLVRIARNRAADHYRGTRATEELPEALCGRENRQNEAAEALDAIRTLPGSYRETLVLRLIEGMTGNEIAEKTGMTPESVRVNLHRGMEQLRQKLGIRRV